MPPDQLGCVLQMPLGQVCGANVSQSVNWQDQFVAADAIDEILGGDKPKEVPVVFSHVLEEAADPALLE